MPQLRHSKTFWSGILTIAFVLWAWDQSKRKEIGVDIVGKASLHIGQSHAGFTIGITGTNNVGIPFNVSTYRHTYRIKPIRQAAGYHRNLGIFEHVVFIRHWLILVPGTLMWPLALWFRAKRIGRLRNLLATQQEEAEVAGGERGQHFQGACAAGH
jgi:hypothetical protein